jgi:hydroxymethylbilane synthase
MCSDRAVLRIGTRGSALALWQANHVADRVRALAGAPDHEFVRIETTGDKILTSPLSTLEGKAFFTKEIEDALLDGRIDLAVHSCKDLATEMPHGLKIGAVLEREDPRDVLVTAGGAATKLEDLPSGARLGTSSLRRRALIAKRRPDIDLVDLRGNVPTRIRKLDEGAFDAIVLAAAGVKRLGLEDRISAYLDSDEILPAVAQGAVAIQIRANDDVTERWVRPLEHAATRAAVTAERALLRELEGGCQVPVGALARIDDEILSLAAIVCSLDGARSVEGRSKERASEAEATGTGLARELLELGAEEILAEIRQLGNGGDR